jgi:hypothetical protein
MFSGVMSGKSGRPNCRSLRKLDFAHHSRGQFIVVAQIVYLKMCILALSGAVFIRFDEGSHNSSIVSALRFAFNTETELVIL